jgi:RecA-family ATPase
VPQTLDGDGGIGKSLTAEGLSVGIASGESIFGKATIQGPVLFVTHEV